MERYGDKLEAALKKYGNLCVGIDPHPSQLESWGLDLSVSGLEKFAMTMIEAMSGTVGVVKPQSAFFERFGSRGIAVLEKLLREAKAVDLLTILDVKRGDIGSTMDGYAHAYLEEGAPLEADAITLSPYLGFGSLKPALDLATECGKGIYVLGLTSNPEGASVQHATDQSGISVAKRIVDAANDINIQVSGRNHIGNLGLVVGATTGEAARILKIDFSNFTGSVLSPGIGAQGASPADIQAIFGQAGPRVLASSSRAIAGKGPKISDLQAAARQNLAEISEIFPGNG